MYTLLPYLTKQSFTTSSQTARVVYINVVIFSIKRFLDKRLDQLHTIDFDRVLRLYDAGRNRRVSVDNNVDWRGDSMRLEDIVEFDSVSKYMLGSEVINTERSSQLDIRLCFMEWETWPYPHFASSKRFLLIARCEFSHSSMTHPC